MRDSDKIAIDEMARKTCLKHGAPVNCKDCDVLWSKAQLYATRAYNAGYRKQCEWISADNPPETYRDEYEELIPFLVCCSGTKYPFRALYDGTNWGDGIGRLDVTHWMPLPEPPKGD